MIHNGYILIYPIRKMTVPSSVSCNANLVKDERTVLNFSTIPNMLCVCVSRKRGLVPVSIYTA